MNKTSTYKVIGTFVNGWVQIEDVNDKQISMIHKDLFPEEPYVDMKVEVTLEFAKVKNVKKV